MPLPTPFYFRPLDYRYRLFSAPTYGWRTGMVRGDRQIFLGPTAVLFFDREGNLIQLQNQRGCPPPKEYCDKFLASSEDDETWLGELQFKEAVVELKRFWLADQWIGIEDMPDLLAEYYVDPERFEMEPEDVQDWMESGQYVFHAGCGDFYMNSAGGVETS